jgi:hypothetical protein
MKGVDNLTTGKSGLRITCGLPTIRTQGCRLSNVDRLERNITLIPNA